MNSLGENHEAYIHGIGCPFATPLVMGLTPLSMPVIFDI
jgi:hypothetical protein